MKRKIFSLVMLILTAAIVPAQTLTTLLNFSRDEGQPRGGLVLSGNVLYGTTVAGIFPNNGMVFSINTNGTSFSALANFSSSLTGPGFPQGNPVLASGMLYGTSVIGGDSGDGTVFSASADGDGFTVLHSFTDSPDGSYPYGSLVLSGNTLYGTTIIGGSDGDGTIFSINTDGSSYTVLHNFAASPDGATPAPSLVISGDTLYGTTSYGGSNYYGTVFSMKIDGSDFAVLYNFSGYCDGRYPLGGLTLSSDTLYGTTSSGGEDGGGTVFSIDTDGSHFQAIYNFSVTNSNWGGDTEGTTGNLLLSGNRLYGASLDWGGDSYGSGTIYSLYTDGSAFTVLHRFSYADPDCECADSDNSDGAIPWDVTLAISGNTLYGTTAAGGSYGGGTIFALQLPTPEPGIQTVVGNYALGGTYSGDGGPALSAGLNLPMGISFDAAGNLWFVDGGNAAVREVSGGTIQTIVNDDYLSTPLGVVVDPSGDIFVADGDWGGLLEFTNWPCEPVVIGSVPALSVARDSSGNLYCVDEYDNTVSEREPCSPTLPDGSSTIAAGNGLQGYSGDGGPPVSASLYVDDYFPIDDFYIIVPGTTVDGLGNIYIADIGNNVIRMVDTSGNISTVAGNNSLGAGYSGDGGSATSAQLSHPAAVAVDSVGNLYIADTGNNVIRKVDACGNISTIAGNNSLSPGYSGDGGPATGAALNYPTSLAFDASGNLYFSDSGNHVIRKVTFNY